LHDTLAGLSQEGKSCLPLKTKDANNCTRNLSYFAASVQPIENRGMLAVGKFDLVVRFSFLAVDFDLN
jgi:hypothetical protein